MSGNLLERFRVITGVATSKNKVPEYEWSIPEQTVQYQQGTKFDFQYSVEYCLLTVRPNKCWLTLKKIYRLRWYFDLI